MPLSRLGLFSVVAFVLMASVVDAKENKQTNQKIDDFTLKSHFGKEYSLHDIAGKKPVVVAFVGAECPLAKLYGRRLGEIAKEFDGRVAFVGIDSNQQDSLQEIAAYADRQGIDFPILKDPGNVVADRFTAARTPEVFVLDSDGIIRYRGRVDDQYGFAEGVGYQRPEPTRRDLVEAIQDVLAGKPVRVETTDVVGCRIGRVKHADENAEVTYSKQVARIFQEHCIECHRAGQIGPFVMTSYEEVVGWGEMIREVVDEERMPPWHANPKHGSFKNDLSLSEKDKETILAWVDAGCPEGDQAELPKPRDFVEGWQIGEPDQIIYMQDDSVEIPAEGVVDYYHFVVDPGWTEDKWIKAAEAKPGSPETVHHILVFLQPPGGSPFGRGGGRPGGGIASGNLIAGYAPGTNPLFDSDGKTAVRAEAGSKLIFQLHYTPNGTPQKDRSYIGFRFAKPREVRFEARSTSVVNPIFVIPPGAENHEATAESTIEYDTLLTCLTPHMHTRGKSFRYEVVYPTGKREILLDVPKYDFNWQTSYHLEKPKKVPKGSQLVCTAHWDNSENNLSNPDPTKKVTWGDQTWEEMMIGFYVEVFPKGKVPQHSSAMRSLTQIDPQKMFESLDTNQDGVLSKDELPDRLVERMFIADSNGDGAISKEELSRIMQMFRRGGDRRRN